MSSWSQDAVRALLRTGRPFFWIETRALATIKGMALERKPLEDA